jgi:class 3 adenylate cyclase/tetratricopeptide (TPR) repeat protein
VATDRLIDELWAGGPPPTARAALQNQVAQLRRALGTDVVVTTPPGYLLAIEPDQIDRCRFEQSLERARACGNAGERAARLREALALWRGPPLTDVAYERFAALEIARLEELHVTVREDLIDAELELGQAAELVPEIEQLVAQRHFDERARAQLMLALYRAGRHHDALQSYQQARRVLVDELGLEPSSPLRELEQAILRQDESLDRAAPPAPPPPSRKKVTILFADLVDSEALAARLDPEALRQLLDRYFRAARGAIERHGGTIEKFIGDAIMAVFGVPVAHEDEPLRAVRAALDTRAALAALNDELEREQDLQLQLRIGLNTGEVFVGDPVDNKALVTGSTVTHAKRLEESAPIGEILVGAETLALVRDAVKATPTTLEQRGAQPAIRAFQLLELIEGAAPIARYFDAPLVGRDAELAALRMAYEAACGQARCGLVTVIGEPGIGKTRLLREVVAGVDEKARVLVGRCISYGEGATFLPLREMIRQLGPDLESLLDGEEQGELVAQQVKALAGLAESASSIEESFWAVRRLFEALGRQRPLLLVYEDLHWAEPKLIDLIEYLAQRARGQILLLCSARPELLDGSTAWSDSALVLEPLAIEEAESLVSGLPGGAELPPKLRARVVAIAEGNPLFAEQLLAHVHEQGAEGLAVVPASLEALLVSRLDLLVPHERTTLQRAAVIGREFSRAALLALSPPEARAVLSADVIALVSKGLVQPTRSGASTDELFRFHHVLVRDVAYAGLAKTERASLHERLADWLGERPGAIDEIVGYHLESAYRYQAELGPVSTPARALAERAAELLARAGRTAGSRDDVTAQANLLSRAVELLQVDDRRRPELLLELGASLTEIGDLAHAKAVLTQAMEIARRRGDERLEARVRVARSWVRALAEPGGGIELLREAEDAARVLEKTGDHLGAARAWELFAAVRHGDGETASAEAAWERSIEHARRAGSRRAELRALEWLAFAAFWGPAPLADARRRCEEILELVRGEPVNESAVRAVLGCMRALEGGFDDARAVQASRIVLLSDLGMERDAALGSYLLGWIELLAGDGCAAERVLRPAYEGLERMGSTGERQVVGSFLAEAVYRQGRLAEAERLALEVEQLDPSGVVDLAHVRGTRAKAIARLGRLEEADRLAREAVALIDRTDFLLDRAEVWMDLAEILHASCRTGEAAAALTEALELHERKGNVVSAERTRALLAELQHAEIEARSIRG